MAPGASIHLATGRSPSGGTRRVAQVLGTRHLIQAALSALAPQPSVLTVGAAVDALHAASMLLLAVADRGARRVALTDALAEALFAAAGLSFAAAANTPLDALDFTSDPAFLKPRPLPKPNLEWGTW